jgi:hypothetical protein
VLNTYLLCHRHAVDECPVAFAAWRGFVSPLRGGTALSSCHTGGHQIWWTVQAPDETGALGLLPCYLARRTEVVQVRNVDIP